MHAFSYGMHEKARYQAFLWHLRAGPKAALAKRVSEVFEIEDTDGVDANSMARSLEAALASHDAALQHAGLPPSNRSSISQATQAAQR